VGWRWAELPIEFEVLKECAAELYWTALRLLPRDVLACLEKAQRSEDDPRASSILGCMLENARLARDASQMLCQDSGIPVFLVRVGRECTFSCDPAEALSAGVEKATRQHSIRANCVDVLKRTNSGTNRGREYPIVHLFVGGEGRGAEVTLLAKGSGSEHRSRLGMLNPIQGLEGAREFILRAVAEGAPFSCPPVVVGVGLGGSFDLVALLSKRALARPLGEHSGVRELAILEQELLDDVNSLGIGPMGLGGRSTALWVSVEAADTHITCNPVSVNLGCWVHRRATADVTEEGFRLRS